MITTTYGEEGLMEVCVPHGNARLEISHILFPSRLVGIGVITSAIAVVQEVHVVSDDRRRGEQTAHVDVERALFLVGLRTDVLEEKTAHGFRYEQGRANCQA